MKDMRSCAESVASFAERSSTRFSSKVGIRSESEDLVKSR